MSVLRMISAPDGLVVQSDRPSPGQHVPSTTARLAGVMGEGSTVDTVVEAFTLLAGNCGFDVLGAVQVHLATGFDEGTTRFEATAPVRRPR